MQVQGGRVSVPKAAVDSHILPTGTLLPLTAQDARFDVAGLSRSSHIFHLAWGTDAYAAFPAFVSRAFRHNDFSRRAGGGTQSPTVFAGRTIAVLEHHMTAAL
ncbi:hypothetical protein GCM10011363_28890 [Marivita lacus]|uniref:Uncharacterized protein n=2 Tax=Marivita lacus TaxID=1323742 RepID=A0ABQ1KTF2_9RHOB|nr:hypothetical protein GCM10011363_28890 [Marivita lacus]